MAFSRMHDADCADQLKADRYPHACPPFILYLLGSLAERFPALWYALGRLEFSLVARNSPEVQRPVFITGLARSGTTVLLELISSLPGMTSHRYRDFPFLKTPVIWNWLLDRVGRREYDLVERPHKDGIFVTPDSPEAMEEILWMSFFPHCHDSAQSSVLGPETSNPQFETFFREHIRKIMLMRKGTRYASKGNYNITRMGYLQKIFPDARFVIPVRNPMNQIASLMEQHRHFCSQQERQRHILTHMRRMGHFEIGLDRRGINTRQDVAAEVARLWAEGQEVRGWARYWAAIYGHVLSTLGNNPGLRDASMIVCLETLCKNPREALEELYRHCELEFDDRTLAAHVARVCLHTPSSPPFDGAELEIIKEETEPVVQALRDLVGSSMDGLRHPNELAARPCSTLRAQAGRSA